MLLPGWCLQGQLRSPNRPSAGGGRSDRAYIRPCHSFRYLSLTLGQEQLRVGPARSSFQEMVLTEELSEADFAELAADAVVWASQHGLVRTPLPGVLVALV